MRSFLSAQPSAEEVPVLAPRGTTPLGFMYKVMGNIFAVLNIRGEGHVTVKCEPHVLEMLRENYARVGKRTHLDPRHWVSIDLEGDVPPKEIERLAARSYELVCEGLTKAQKAKLAAHAE